MCKTFTLLCGRVFLRSQGSHFSLAPQKISNYCTQNKEKVIKLIQLNKPSRPKENVPNGKPSDQSSRKSPFKVSSLLLLYIFLIYAVPGVTFCLGCWQYRRLKWKLALIDSLSKSIEEAAVDFPVHDLSMLDNMEYRRVHLKGQFLYDRQFYIAHRARFDKGSSGNNPSGLMGSADSTSHGSHIVAPFKIHGSDIVIMVNRGWLPPNKVQEELSNKKRPSTVVEFDAIVRKPEAKPWFFEGNIPEKSVWLYKDFEQMGQWCGALPIFVDAVYDSSAPNGPIGGQTNVTLRNEHLTYMITWFSMSAFTFVTWLMTYAKGLSRK